MPTTQIGRYQIKRELGRGGMATVFLAYDPRFEREIAIKVLPPNFLDDPQLRTRFEREAKMIALLEHPAIVPVYDFGEQDGQPYIVMRYMSGGSMADRIKQGAISPEETANMISRLAPALDAAHSRGIVHRDLKPANILFDQYGNGFLSDFGIAHLGESGGTTLTGESIVGTPAYMSPEQVQADKTIDGRSDLYSMGVLVYQMLTGQAPYQADTPARVMLMHILEPVPNILEKKSDLPPACKTVIAKAMAKNPEDRYQTTAELSSALDTAVRRPQAQMHTEQEEENTLFGGQTMVASPRIADSATQVAAPKPAPPADIQADSARPARRFPVYAIAILALLVVIGGGLAGGLSLLKDRTQLPAVTNTLPGSLPPTLTTGPEAAQVEASPTSLPVTGPVVAPLLSPTFTLEVQTPTETAATAAPTLAATSTLTSTLSALTLGGADKIAFIKDRNLWIANVDGTQPEQLTEDPKERTGLQWTSDGNALVYISGQCAYALSYPEGRIDTLACFSYVTSFEAFEISPSLKQVAITLDHQLYIVHYDKDKLSQVKTRSDLVALAVCEYFAPYKAVMMKQVQWSKDETRVAGVVMGVGVLAGGVRADVVQVLEVQHCTSTPNVLDNFPASRFTVKGYNKNPTIPHISWDGISMFAFNNIVRNGSFGDLYTYNTTLFKAQTEIDPVDNVCCYADAHWSPDGNYLAFAFQSLKEGAGSSTKIYYVPYGDIGTGAPFNPLPLPEITDQREQPQPVLRPAGG